METSINPDIKANAHHLSVSTITSLNFNILSKPTCSILWCILFTVNAIKNLEIKLSLGAIWKGEVSGPIFYLANSNILIKIGTSTIYCFMGTIELLDCKEVNCRNGVVFSSINKVFADTLQIPRGQTEKSLPFIKVFTVTLSWRFCLIQKIAINYKIRFYSEIKQKMTRMTL